MEVNNQQLSVQAQRFFYGQGSEQFGELYLPDSADPKAVVILIHGGYWKNNHNLNSYATQTLVPYLLSKGVAVWNLEYRRMNTEGENTLAPWPAIFIDIANGVDYLRQLSATQRLNLNNVSAIGHSAGGCLAVWAASRRNIPLSSPLYQQSPLTIHNVMSVAGVLHLSNPQELGQPQQIHRLMGGEVQEYPERYAACDPSLLHDARVNTYIIHSKNDETVSLNQALHYCAQYGGNAQQTIWAEGSHFSMLPHDGDWLESQWQELQQLIGKMLD